MKKQTGVFQNSDKNRCQITLAELGLALLEIQGWLEAPKQKALSKQISLTEPNFCELFISEKVCRGKKGYPILH